MSTTFPSTSPFGPAGPTGTSHGMGAEGAHPNASPVAHMMSQPPTTPAQHAAMDPATHGPNHMVAGLGALQNNQHAIHHAPTAAYQWPRTPYGPTAS